MRQLLRGLGWQLRAPESEEVLDRAITAATTLKAPGLAAFLADACGAVSADETSWFLSSSDYAGTSGAAFSWNAWELLSLETAGDDEGWRSEIRAFWARHVPFLLSVRDDYAYLALALDGARAGAVVHGRAPEFEEADVVADSLEAFSTSVQSVLLHAQML
jgi:hypothetical protein